MLFIEILFAFPVILLYTEFINNPKGWNIMEHIVLGYAFRAALSEVTAEDTHKLTHMNIAFGLIKDGLLDMSGLPNLDRCVTNYRQWNPELKLVLSVGGWGAGGFSTMAMTEEGRRAFAASCLEVVEQYGLDGIDIDWEYPCSALAEIDYDPKDKENYTLLLQALRDALGENRILSIAVGAGEYFVEGTEMDKVAQIVDYVQLMTYDMRNGFTRESGHHASLGLTKGDTSNTSTRGIVEMFHEAGVPYERMVVGAAFYSRQFDGVPNVNNGLLQSAESVGGAGPYYSQLTEEFRKAGNYTEYWDEDAEAAYLFNGSTFITYESPEAIRRKCLYVKEKGLLGIMFWEHGCDLTRELLDTMHETMTN